MFARLNHLHRNDLALLALVGGSLLLLGGQLLQLAGESQATGGWRKIDLTAVQKRLDSGALSHKPADWVHSASERERTP